MQIVKIGRDKKRKDKLRSFIIDVFTQIITLIIVLSPLLNSLGQDSVIYKYSYYFMAFICSCFCFNSINKLLAITVSSFCLGILIFLDLGVALSLALGIVCSLSTYRNKEEFSSAIIHITYFQLALSIAQLFGVNEYVYLFANYNNPPSTYQQWSLSQNVTTTFLPQIRPSGIFPSPTYSSLFLCSVLLSIFIKRELSLLSSIIIGLLISVSGSTFSLLIILICVILFIKTYWGKAIILSYIVGMLLYFASLPDIFLYNYNIYDFCDSISCRFIPENNLSESVLFQSTSGSIFVICSLMILIFISLKQIIYKPYIILPATVILFPVLVHNVASSVVYFFLSALSIKVAYDAYAKNKRPSKRYTELLKCAEYQKE